MVRWEQNIVTRQISITTRKELVEALRVRYGSAPFGERIRILDEFVALTGYHRKFVAQGLPTGRMRLGPQFEFTSRLIQAVASGIGVGLLPTFLVADKLRNGVLETAFDLRHETGAAYYLFVPPEKLSLPPVVVFRDWLLEQRDKSPAH